MYAPSAYTTTPTVPYQVVSEPVTGEDTLRSIVIIKQAVRTTSTNELTQEVHHFKVTVDLSKVVDFDDEVSFPPPRKPRQSGVKTPFREIVEPWRAKWRLKQQRPRDGLRS